MARLPCVLLVALATSAMAQTQPDPAAQRAAIARLAWMAGRWEGPSTFTMPQGPVAGRTIDTMQVVAGGTALVVRARHYLAAANGSPGELLQDIAALISWDSVAGRYRVVMQSVLGHHHELEATLEGDTFTFGLPAPEGQVRVRMRRNAAGQFTEQAMLCRQPSRCEAPDFSVVLDRVGDAP